MASLPIIIAADGQVNVSADVDATNTIVALRGVNFSSRPVFLSVSLPNGQRKTDATIPANTTTEQVLSLPPGQQIALTPRPGRDRWEDATVRCLYPSD